MSTANMMITITIINNLMLMVSLTMNSNKNKEHNKTNTSFECGFNEKTTMMTPFSVNFFMITILFLIFDLEISIITPSIFMNNMSKATTTIMMVFIIAITTMLTNEWMVGMMEWTK